MCCSASPRKWFWASVTSFDTHDELLAAEAQAIRSEKPLHNLVHNGAGR